MRVAIVAALPVEQSEIPSHLSHRREESVGPLTVSVGQLDSVEVVTAVIGVGMRRAATGAEAILTQFSPDAIILCGLAGSLDSTLTIGTVVLASEVVLEERGPSSRWRWVRPFFRRTVYPLGSPMATDPGLLAVARSTAQAGTIPFAEGRMVCTGEPVMNPMLRRRLWQATGGMVVEMESAAVARVAKEHGVPFLAVKGISDSAGWLGILEFQRNKGSVASPVQTVALATARQYRSMGTNKPI